MAVCERCGKKKAGKQQVVVGGNTAHARRHELGREKGQAHTLQTEASRQRECVEKKAHITSRLLRLCTKPDIVALEAGNLPQQPLPTGTASSSATGPNPGKEDGASSLNGVPLSTDTAAAHSGIDTAPPPTMPRRAPPLPRKSRAARHLFHASEEASMTATLSSVGVPNAGDLVDAMFRAMGVRTLADMNLEVQRAVRVLVGREATSSGVDAQAQCPSGQEAREWKTCSGACEAAIKPMIDAELGSTAYMLRALTNSVMSASEHGSSSLGRAPSNSATTSSGTSSHDDAAPFIRFEATGPLTGVWAVDASRLRIAHLGRRRGTESPARGRLIMGFGPSAAGKTHWAQTLLDLFSEADPGGFPDTLMCVDGGIHRATSAVYAAIVNAAKRNCVRGLDNLVLSGLSVFTTSLFSSDKVKVPQVVFLKRQKHIPISLYVPETLGGCDWVPFGKIFGAASCTDKYSAYIEITGDAASWIGLFIWQHKSGAECDQSGERKCKGCVESGAEREAFEGKRYSSAAHAHSMREGLKAIQSAPGGRYVIHNGGARGRVSLFQDLTSYTGTNRHVQRALVSAQSKHAFSYSDSRKLRLWSGFSEES